MSGDIRRSVRWNQPAMTVPGRALYGASKTTTEADSTTWTAAVPTEDVIALAHSKAKEAADLAEQSHRAARNAEDAARRVAEALKESESHALRALEFAQQARAAADAAKAYAVMSWSPSTQLAPPHESAKTPDDRSSRSGWVEC